MIACANACRCCAQSVMSFSSTATTCPRTMRDVFSSSRAALAPSKRAVAGANTWRLARTRLRSSASVEAFVSKLRTHEDAKFDGSKFSHFINHGFVVTERDQVHELAIAAAAIFAIDGIVFRVSRRQSPCETFQQLSTIGEDLGMCPMAYAWLVKARLMR